MSVQGAGLCRPSGRAMWSTASGENAGRDERAGSALRDTVRPLGRSGDASAPYSWTSGGC